MSKGIGPRGPRGSSVSRAGYLTGTSASGVFVRTLSPAAHGPALIALDHGRPGAQVSRKAAARAMGLRQKARLILRHDEGKSRRDGRHVVGQLRPYGAAACVDPGPAWIQSYWIQSYLTTRAYWQISHPGPRRFRGATSRQS